MSMPSAAALASMAWRHPRYFEHLLIRKLKFLARYRWLDAHPAEDDSVPPPLVFKLVLTYRCNLRCGMCYQWGTEGWCHEDPATASRGDMPWSVVEKVLEQARQRCSSFILIGGEPMLYSEFGRLADALKATRSVAITCTNGLLIDRFLEASTDNPYLTYLVSLDGLEAQNDAIRGAGVYTRVARNIRQLKRLPRPPYVGVQFTIRPENVHVMFDFCREMVDLGADWVLLNPSWFVSEEQARAYEAYMQQHFGFTPTSHRGYMLPYDIDQDEFVRQYARIRSERWPIQISCYLEEPEDIRTFVDRPEVPPRNEFCFKQWLRMDVEPDGSVCPCVLYPDLSVGNLTTESVLEVWNSPQQARFRTLRREGPLPICSKCDVLYLYDAKRRAL